MDQLKGQTHRKVDFIFDEKFLWEINPDVYKTSGNQLVYVNTVSLGGFKFKIYCKRIKYTYIDIFHLKVLRAGSKVFEGLGKMKQIFPHERLKSTRLQFPSVLDTLQGICRCIMLIFCYLKLMTVFVLDFLNNNKTVVKKQLCSLLTRLRSISLCV